MTIRQITILLGFAVAVWAFCGAIMGVGSLFMSMDTTLIVHLAGGPVGAATASWLYTRLFGFTGPTVTAMIFVATALILDFFLVSMIVMRSFEMFSSVVGLWLPMVLIFIAAVIAADLAGQSAAPVR